MPKVLVVDDEKSIRVSFCEFLRREGYDAVFAKDAETAFEILENNDYDVVVSDIIMPRISGIDMLSKIRDISSNIQIIIMTGEPTVETAMEAVRNGACDYLPKPISKDSLIKAVLNAVRIKSLQDEKLNLLKQNLEYQKNLEALVKEKTKDLNEAMKSIVYLLSSVVEVRDPYTAGHQKKVGNLAAAIATKLGLDGNSINRLRLIGYIHDIGKISVPTEILVRPGSLSKLEMEIIRYHPTQGFEMINMVDLPQKVAQTIYQHHERCDGSGYPRGIKGDEILDETHIVIVADVVEAMMSHRPYRPAVGIKAALTEILKNSGKLYNSDVVKACADLFLIDKYQLDEVQHSINFPLM